MTDCLLIFPAVTEARLFPYLSLPMLTAFLRRSGLDVSQVDLNLQHIRALLTPENLETLRSADRSEKTAPLAARLRQELAAFAIEQCEGLTDRVFNNNHQNSSATDIRFATTYIELLLEGSRLKEPLSQLSQLDELVDAPIPTDDLAATLLRRELEATLRAHPPRCVGFSVPFFSQLLPTLLLARWVREASPSTRVILGGQQIMLRSSELLTLRCVRHSVDALCVGPGEEALLGFTLWSRGEAPQTDVPEVRWVNAETAVTPRRTRLRLADVPPPDFDDLPIRSYVMEETHLPLITCVGCYWGRCVYCSYGNRSLRDGYDQKTPVQIADEVEHLVDRYGVTRINFVDENTNLQLIISALRELKRRGRQITCSTRNRLEPQLESQAFCKELASLGCVLMGVGYETSSQRLLDLMDKGVDSARYETILDNLHAAGIVLNFSIMGGLPGETSEEAAESRAFLKRNAHKFGIDVMQMLICEPGTRLQQNPAAFGLELVPGDGSIQSNRRYSYGQGRAGIPFLQPDGDSFARREAEFEKLFWETPAGKNDLLPPTVRPLDVQDGEVTALRLHPWIRCVEANMAADQEPRPLLLDLLWQTFYGQPPGLQVNQGVARFARPAQQVLMKMAAAGLGVPLYESRGMA